MKRIVLAVGMLAALVFAGTASAHTTGFSASAECNTQTGKYDLKWTVGPTSDQNLSPKIFASDRSSIPVGSTLGTSTDFTESVPGNTTSVSANITVRWSDNFKQDKTTNLSLDGNCKTPPPPNPKCPEGYTAAGTSDGVLLCTKETIKTVTNTVTVNVPGPTVYVDKIVFGTCPSTTTLAQTPTGPVCLTPSPTITVIQRVPYKVTVVKWHTRNHTKVVRIKWCPVPPVCKTNCSGPGKG
jgi:hypothetical protein